MTHVPGRPAAQGPVAWFRGDGAVTGVGSLPFETPAPAIDAVARWCPEIPFWPQLRRMNPREAIIPQTLGPLFRHVSPVRGEHAFAVAEERLPAFVAALERAEPCLDPDHAAGFHAFCEAFARGRFPAARAVKGQVMGPVTAACTLMTGSAPFLERADLRRVLGDHIARLARWQCTELLKLSPSALVVIDEAYLGVALRRHATQRAAIVDLLRSVVLRVRRPGVTVGVHCCDEIPFEVLAEIAPDLYSFDAGHGGEAFAADPAAAAFVAGGGQVAWGWVPTLDDLGAVDAQVLADRWWKGAARLSAAAGLEPGAILARSLVTASCGLAGSSIATCERSFAIAREVSAAFASRLVPL